VTNQESRTAHNSEQEPTDDGASSATGTAAADVERLQSELADARDRILRVQAELENFRRRSRRELEDERKYANVPLLRDLLPVVDNIDRAIEAAGKTQDSNSLLEGIKMVKQQLETVLQRYHCKPVKAHGEHFDPHFHEAISMQPSPEHDESTVLHVAQSGYQVHDRVIRPAQVIVSTAAPKE
jgi:molecular chaperone GrpE